MNENGTGKKTSGKGVKMVEEQAEHPNGCSIGCSNLDLDWHEQYNTGISEIDSQHRYFLGLIKRINAIMESKKEHTYCQRLLMELVHYTKFHFYSEENLMMHYDYPDIKEHHSLHLDLIDELTNEVNLMGENMDDYRQFIEFLVKWFVNHSMEEDKKIASYLKGDV